MRVGLDSGVQGGIDWWTLLNRKLNFLGPEIVGNSLTRYATINL
jgi:hypothetical protein